MTAGPDGCSRIESQSAGATIAAENGATTHQLMAIFGWDTLKQAEVYTRAADQKRLAESAMHLLDQPKIVDDPSTALENEPGSKLGPTLGSGGTYGEKAK